MELRGITCLDIGVDLKIDYVEDEDDVEIAPKEFLDLIYRHERTISAEQLITLRGKSRDWE